MLAEWVALSGQPVLIKKPTGESPGLVSNMIGQLLMEMGGARNGWHK